MLEDQSQIEDHFLLISRLCASGSAKDYPVDRLYQDACFLLFGDDTSEILKNIIAKQLLDL